MESNDENKEKENSNIRWKIRIVDNEYENNNEIISIY